MARNSTIITNAEPGDAAWPRPDKVICACANLTFDDLRKSVATLHYESFETLLDMTGSGRTCTACLLDLEHYFVSLPKEGDAPAARSRNGDAGAQRRSLKYRLYDWLDGISPQLPWVGPNLFPVVAGAGIETWLSIANHDLLFKERMSAPLRSTVWLHGADGALVSRRCHRIPPGEALRVRLDPGAGEGPLWAGSARIETRAEHPALRGTMRPQFEIVAPAGVCAVHVQGIAGPGDTWFAVQNRPGEERLFVAVINATRRALNAAVAYPGLTQTDDAARLKIPPHGCRLYELTPTAAQAREIGTAPYDVRLTCDRANKAFLLCASPDLGRFSVDHP